MQQYPKSESPCQVSANGGYQVAWGKAPGVLYFLRPNGMMMRATLNLGAGRPCPMVAPTELVQTAVRSARNARSYFDVAPDGRLVINSPKVSEGVWLSVKTQWLAAANLKP